MSPIHDKNSPTAFYSRCFISKSDFREMYTKWCRVLLVHPAHVFVFTHGRAPLTFRRQSPNIHLALTPRKLHPAVWFAVIPPLIARCSDSYPELRWMRDRDRGRNYPLCSNPVGDTGCNILYITRNYAYNGHACEGVYMVLIQDNWLPTLSWLMCEDPGGQ